MNTRTCDCHHGKYSFCRFSIIIYLLQLLVCLSYLSYVVGYYFEICIINIDESLWNDMCLSGAIHVWMGWFSLFLCRFLSDKKKLTYSPRPLFKRKPSIWVKYFIIIAVYFCSVFKLSCMWVFCGLLFDVAMELKNKRVNSSLIAAIKLNQNSLYS